MRAEVCAAIAFSFVLASVASAQQYRLTEEDTWEPAEQIDPASPEGQLAQARAALARGEFDRARELASAWIERHETHSLLPEAYLIRGNALHAQEEHYKALYDYEFVARSYPGSQAFVDALQKELEIARLFAYGKRRKLWGFRVINATDEAEELLIRIQERLPGSELAEEAGMELADFYFRRGDMPLAAEAYSLFVENYPDSPRISKARRRLIYANLASFKGPEFDITGLFQARALLEEFKAVEPLTSEQIGADAIIAAIDERLAQKLLTTARWYLRTNDPIAAELTIRRLLATQPRSVAAAEAIELLPELLPRLPESVLREAPDYRSLIEVGAVEGQTREEAAPDPESANAPAAAPPASESR